MDNALRCPQCYLPPLLFLESGAVYLHCPEHGHVARGRNTQEAVSNWNIYIDFVKRDTSLIVKGDK